MEEFLYITSLGEPVNVNEVWTSIPEILELNGEEEEK